MGSGAPKKTIFSKPIGFSSPFPFPSASWDVSWSFSRRYSFSFQGPKSSFVALLLLQQAVEVVLKIPLKVALKIIQVIVNRCWLKSWFVRFPLFPRWITHFQILIKYKIKVIRFSCANFFSGNKGNRRYIREFLPPTGANDLSSALTEGFKEMYWRDCLCSAGWSPCQCSMNYGDDPMNASCYSLFCLLDPC